MARVGDEAALSLERRLQPGEHRVERLSQPAQLVARRRQCQPPPRLGCGHHLGLAPHRLHRPQGCSREEVAADRREEQGERADDEELGEQAVERVLRVLERDADREHSRPVDRGHEQTEAVAFHRERAAEATADLGEDEDRLLAARRRVEQPAARVVQLRDALVPGGAELVRRPDLRRPELERLVEPIHERALEPYVEERAERAQHDGHRNREGEREPPADRQPAHSPPSTRRRYPAPRTVSIERTRNGRSIFSRR